MKDLWRKGGPLKRPFYSASMARDRFCQLRVALRFDLKSARDTKKDKLAAIRDLVDLVVKNFLKAYNPGANVCLDERLSPFRGRCSFKMYIPSKPAKYGIKVWMLVDCDSNYVYNFQIYVGKIDGKREVNQAHRVVMNMTKPLQSGHNVTFDNFFTSKSVAEDLLRRNITCLGTVNSKRTMIPANMLASNEESCLITFSCTQRT